MKIKVNKNIKRYNSVQLVLANQDTRNVLVKHMGGSSSNGYPVAEQPEFSIEAAPSESIADVK